MSAVEEHREKIANRLGEPDRLRFPSDWTLSTSWRRAQAAPSNVTPRNPAEFEVLMGREDDETALSRHSVLFALYEGTRATPLQSATVTATAIAAGAPTSRCSGGCGAETTSP